MKGKKYFHTFGKKRALTRVFLSMPASADMSTRDTFRRSEIVFTWANARPCFVAVVFIRFFLRLAHFKTSLFVNLSLFQQKVWCLNAKISNMNSTGANGKQETNPKDTFIVTVHELFDGVKSIGSEIKYAGKIVGTIHWLVAAKISLLAWYCSLEQNLSRI